MKKETNSFWLSQSKEDGMKKSACRKLSRTSKNHVCYENRFGDKGECATKGT